MVTSPSNLISANQYFASNIWTRHSKYKAMRAGPYSTPTQSLGGPARRLRVTWPLVLSKSVVACSIKPILKLSMYHLVKVSHFQTFVS